MFKRKITSILKDWKSDPDRNPIIVKGCRQCGKTFSVKDFAYKNYKNVIYMDFHEQQGLRELFADSLTVDYLTMAISAAMPDAVFATAS